jgi:uncharacterized protein (TIGR02466 family)
MGQSQDLFPIKVYKDFYANVEDLKTNLFPKLDTVFEETKNNNNAFMRDGTLCSYKTNSYLHVNFPDETKEVVEFVEAAAREYWKECNYHSELHPYVMQMWANSTPKDGWIQGHLHGSMPFTAVLYVDASPEQGNLFLENPMDMVLMSQPISPDVRYPMGQEIEVRSGDLVMFPGYLKHSVKPNTTDKPRLILAFNLASKGKYWAGQWVKD